MIKLKEKDEKRLSLLAQLIDAGSEEFTREISLDNMSPKQTVLYLNFAAVNNYAEAIYKLCVDMRPFPAITILRSIVEAYINTAYVLIYNSNKRVWLFSLEDTYYRIGTSHLMIDFLKKHPDFVKDSDRFNIQTFELGLKKLQSELSDYKSNLGIEFKNKKDFESTYHSKLIERAKAVDRRLKKPTFEHTYLLAYRYYSEYTHLSMRGLDHFINKGIDGNHEVIASQHDEVDHIVSMTYTIYLQFLAELKKREMLSSKFPMQDFAKKWREL